MDPETFFFVYYKIIFHKTILKSQESLHKFF